MEFFVVTKNLPKQEAFGPLATFPPISSPMLQCSTNLNPMEFILRENTVRQYRFIQADVFTEVIFGGNPVAVFTDAEGLSDDEMQKIAREMNLSETAYVFPATAPNADYYVRFFTPYTELPFAGHPTIGTQVILASMGMYEITGPVTRVFQQTRSGVYAVDLITDGNGTTDRAVMTHADARHGDIIEDLDLVASAIGLTPEDIEADIPTQVYSTGLPGLIIPIVSLEAIRRIEINTPVFNDICSSVGVTGASAFTLETLDNAHHAHVRNFDPLVGVAEDPATGSMAGALGAYILGKQLLPYEKEFSTNHMVFEQGYSIGRPSLLEVEVDIRDGHVDEVRVGGQVVIVLEGELTLP